MGIMIDWILIIAISRNSEGETDKERSESSERTCRIGESTSHQNNYAGT